MVTYWLIGETTSGSRNRAHQKRQVQMISTVDHTGEKRRLKSSLRNRMSSSPGRPFGRGQLLDTHQLTSSLDSPKKLRFANSSDEDHNEVDCCSEQQRHRHIQEPMTAPSSFDTVDEIASNSKRNSCPNLNNCAGGIVNTNCSSEESNRVLQKPHFHKKYRMSGTASLVDVCTFPTITETTATTTTTTSINSSPLLSRTPKIELSSPEETERLSLTNDCRWPLLRDEQHKSGGCVSNSREKANGDRETVVWRRWLIYSFFSFTFDSACSLLVISHSHFLHPIRLFFFPLRA